MGYREGGADGGWGRGVGCWHVWNGIIYIHLLPAYIKLPPKTYYKNAIVHVEDISYSIISSLISYNIPKGIGEMIIRCK